MSISAIAAPAPLRPPEPIEPKPPEVKAAEDSRTPQPTVLAALPPGQGTRINQIA
jgi:hypothetical protein